MNIRHYISQRLVYLFLLPVLVVGGCESGHFKTSPKKPAAPDVKAAREHLVRVESEKGATDKHQVFIEAKDIELPLTATSLEPQDERLYRFSVWAYHPDLSGKKTISELLDQDLQVEVVGVKATIRPVEYGGRGTNTMDSRGQVEVIVSSKDITESFSIIAWFPHESEAYLTGKRQALANLRSKLDQGKKNFDPALLTEISREIELKVSEKNPWVDQKRIRVYSGDVRAQILIVGRDELEDSFGPQFAKYFMAGRIYIRNRRADKNLAVYTTSIKANTLFYRSPEEAAKALAKEIEATSYNSTRGALIEKYRYYESRLSTELYNLPVSQTRQGLDRNQINVIVDETRRHPSKEKPEEVLKTCNVSWDPLAKEAQQAEGTQIIIETQRALDSMRAQLKAKPETFGWDGKPESRPGFIEAFANAIQNPSGASPEVQQAVRNALSELTYRIGSIFLILSTPLDTPVPTSVGPHQKPIAFSDKTAEELLYNAHGYMWSDYYRPMTFQSVLNSLIASTENSGRAQVLKWLESAGIVAGGLVGMGTVLTEVTSRAYIESVAVTTAVILPEARKLLLDDLSKYVKNLGDLGMDTVVVIPPNGVVDKYVFFPRGPIFNGADEYSVSQPKFIVDIDNSDVAVEATLIEKEQTVSSGSQSASALTAAAIDAGTSTMNADDAKRATMMDSLRTFSLMNLRAQVDALTKQGRTTRIRRIPDAKHEELARKL